MAKIASVSLGLKGGQRGQFSKCEAELLPRGARAVTAFESPCPRAETGRGSGTRPARGTRGNFRGKGLFRTEGSPRARGRARRGEASFHRTPDVPSSPGVPASLHPRAPSQGCAALHPSHFGSNDGSRTRVTNFIPRSFPQAKSRRKQAREQTQTNKKRRGVGRRGGSLSPRVQSVKHI